MKETKKVGNKWLSIRVNEKEYQVIEDLYQKTTCRSISEYARNILLEKPVIIKYRNESADQFLTQMIAFKTN